MVAAPEFADKFGIGWREPLAAGIFSHLGQIDVIEVIAENCLHESRRRQRSLRALGREVPMLVHGVSLGAASVSGIDVRRLDGMARLVGALEPAAWSEHLSFVRSGGIEIGHLAAPPRNPATVEGAVRNLAAMRRAVGITPAMENIATLMAPPASTMDEPAWATAIVAAAGVPMLLDLHNLYANAVNFGFEPLPYLLQFPLGAVRLVHISGGVWLESDDGAALSRCRLLDDHLHDVPDPVFDMLDLLGEHCPHPVTVILERDGCFPNMACLLAQLQRARTAVADGRRRALTRGAHERSAA